MKTYVLVGVVVGVVVGLTSVLLGGNMIYWGVGAGALAALIAGQIENRKKG